MHKLHLCVIPHRDRRDLLVVECLLEDVVVDCLGHNVPVWLLGHSDFDVASASSTLISCHGRCLQHLSGDCLRLATTHRPLLREAFVVVAFLAHGLRVFGRHFELHLLHRRHLRAIQHRLCSLLSHCALTHVGKHTSNVLV